MEGREKVTRRRPRSDGAANRAKILEAAHTAFREEVSDISLEEIARRAGVGIGTLYRHFASRDVLAAAVYHQEVDDLVSLAAQLEGEGDAAAALRRWLRAMVGFVATKKGMAAALARSARMPSELTDYSSDHLVGAVERLLTRVAREGRVAPTIAGQDVLLMLVALSYEFDGLGWEERVGRLLDIFVQGLTRTADG